MEPSSAINAAAISTAAAPADGQYVFLCTMLKCVWFYSDVVLVNVTFQIFEPINFVNTHNGRFFFIYSLLDWRKSLGLQSDSVPRSSTPIARVSLTVH